MIRYILSILIAISICLPANDIQGQGKGSKTETHSFHSEALDSTLTYNIYLPPGYGDSGQSYPVFYLLHGYVGDHTDWVEKGKIDQTINKMLREGTTKPFIVVMPDAHNSWYVDSDSTISWGHYETAIIRDLRKHIEDKYATISKSNSRYIAGLSMGGYGSLHLAFKYPDLFRAAASLSGAFMPELPEGSEILEGTFGKPADHDKYQKENPFILASKDSSRQLPVYITCGDDDKGLLHYSVAMYDTLQKKGYVSELRITDGAHNWRVWSREIKDVIRFFNGH